MVYNNSFRTKILKEKTSNSKKLSSDAHYEKLTHYKYAIEKVVSKRSSFDGPYEKLALYKRTMEKEVNQGIKGMLSSYKIEINKGIDPIQEKLTFSALHTRGLKLPEY